MHNAKAQGMVREAFRTRDMRALLGYVGLGHVRYATKGTASNEEEMQPFYVNAPYGIILIHNGNLTNTRELTADMAKRDRRHLNSSSDTELLLNVLAGELQNTTSTVDLDARAGVRGRRPHARAHRGRLRRDRRDRRIRAARIRDPFGIRPLILGRRPSTVPGAEGKDEWVVASESLVLENGDYEVVREVEPGEAVFITNDGELFSQQCATAATLAPCAFEYVYLARPDSVMNGISVYESRLRMGDRLADTIAKHVPMDKIDVVMPIPRLLAARRDGGRGASSASSTARASTRTATSVAHSSCRAERCARRACARSSTRCRPSSRARTCC